MKPLIITNHNPKKIIVQTDYDEKCNVYRISVKLVNGKEQKEKWTENIIQVMKERRKKNNGNWW